MSDFFIFISTIILFLLVGVLPLVAGLFSSERREKGRYSPLTRDMLRPPGYALEVEVERLRGKLESLALLSILVSLGFIFLWVLLHERGQGTILVAVVHLILLILIESRIAFQVRTLYRDMQTKRKGLEGERATAEELNQLMLHGIRVFHDIPTDYGNIDHVVVSSAGVFSINTKAWSKYENDESVKVKVDYKNEQIKLANRVHKLPVKELQTEANWLSRFLSESTGTPVSVKPMLALPGWFLDYPSNPPFVVFNPKSSKKFFSSNTVVLESSLQDQIVYQLDQKCRSIEPRYKRNKKEWGSQ